jgi:Xaa-Pro aminopeptidase
MRIRTSQGFPAAGVTTDRIVRSDEPNRVKLVCGRDGVAPAHRGTGRARRRSLPAWRYARILQDEFPGVDWIPADELVESVRRHKSLLELDCMREGGQIVTAALTKQLEQAVRGGTQADIAAARAHELLRRGGNFHMIPVASGTGRELEPFTNEPLTGFDVRISTHLGDLVRTWIHGPAWQGYWLDPGRTVVVGGKPAGAQRALISAAGSSHERASCLADMRKHLNSR